MRRLPPLPFILVILILTFWSCERMSDTATDPILDSPYLVVLSLNHETVNLDTDTTAAALGNNRYRVTLRAAITALRNGSSGPFTASISVTRPGQSDALTRISTTLLNPGGDTLTGNVALSFIVLRSEIGAFGIHCSIRPAAGNPGNELTRSVVITRRNSRPHIDSLSVPDSVVIGHIPAVDSSFLITVSVSDSDGISDIPEFGGVQFFSIKPDGSPANFGQPIWLFDDGSRYVLFPPDGRSGDKVEGDGTFSFRVRLLARVKNSFPPPDSIDTQRGIYRFRFFAIDNSTFTTGITSDTVDHFIKVK